MDLAQIESIERKPELQATLEELENVMGLMNNQRSKGVKKSVLESNDLHFTQKNDDALTVTSLRLVQLFYAQKELDTMQSTGQQYSGSLEVLAPFLSHLFQVATAAGITRSKSDVQIFLSMVKKLAGASPDTISEGTSTTYALICDEIDHIIHPSEGIKLNLFDKKNFSMESNEGLKLSLSTVEQYVAVEDMAQIDSRVIAQPSDSLIGSRFYPEDLSCTAARPSLPLVPQTMERFGQELPLQEDLQISDHVQQTSWNMTRQHQDEHVQDHNHPIFQDQGQQDERCSNSQSSSHHARTHLEYSTSHQGKVRTSRRHQHHGGFTAGNHSPMRQQDTYLKHTNSLPQAVPCAGLQLQPLANVHVQPIFHHQYYQYPHYYYPGYPANYNDIMTNKFNPGDADTDERSGGATETSSQPRSLEPIHEHDEYSNCDN
ncbi:hypothetical protein BGX27_004584 [Mortierella sp. AM989]|nr:hypothetical protein BGX27_004584 [Mortierella sp. AM989]